MFNPRQPSTARSMQFDSPHGINGPGGNLSESAFAYWEKACNLSHEFHSSQIPFVKRGIDGLLVYVDEIFAAIETGNLHTESGLCTKPAASDGGTHVFANEIDEHYRRSVEHWNQNMEKLRISSNLNGAEGSADAIAQSKLPDPLMRLRYMGGFIAYPLTDSQ